MSVDGSRNEADVRSEGWAVSRRVLLKAGWTVPVILTVAPSIAFAASGSPPGSSIGGTTTTRSTPTSTTVGGTPTPNGGGTVPPTGGGGSSGGIPEQQSQGPQPAQINRGFTG